MSLSALPSDKLFIIAVAGLVIAALASELLLRCAAHTGLLDRPSEIKIHTEPVPRVGGIAIFTAYLVSLLFVFLLTPYLHREVGALILPLLGIFLCGFLDDRFSLSPSYKLRLILAVTILTVAFGTHLSWLPALTGIVLLTLLSNAVNLLDGMNGLAGGVMLIAFAALGVLLVGAGDYDYALAAFLMIPAILGFLLHNFSGRIFMGDAGSLMLGFLAGTLLLRLLELSTIAFAGGVIVLAVPLVDTIYVVTVRALSGRHLFSGDLNHTYNHLQRSLGSTRIVLAIYYTAAILLAVIGCWIAGG